MTRQTVHRKLAAVLICLPLLGMPSSSLGQDSEMEIKCPKMHAHACRKVVVFPHEEHMDMLECLDCHHDYQNGENVLDEDDLEEGNPDIQCASCHSPKLNCFSSSSKLSLRHAFHQQCVGCHRKARLNREVSGPEFCGECHKK